MNHNISYYDLLQVSPYACKEVIEAAYRTLQKQMHPDMGGDKELAQAINEAKDILTDPLSRNRYDTSLKLGKAQSPFQPKTIEKVIERKVVETHVFCLYCGAKNRVTSEKADLGVCGRCKSSFKSNRSQTAHSTVNSGIDFTDDQLEILCDVLKERMDDLADEITYFTNNPRALILEGDGVSLEDYRNYRARVHALFLLVSLRQK